MTYPRMRRLDLNEPVTVTLPAHVWLGYIASYGNAKWASPYATAVLTEAQEALFDPVDLKERQAEAQREHDAHQEFLSHIIPGIQPPGVPPDTEGLT